MSFKHKLSRRLALLRDVLVIAALAATGCERIAHLAGPTSDVTQLVVSPKTLTLLPNATAEFTAVGLTASGDTGQVKVNWSVTGGTITDTSSNGGKHYGQYKSGSQPGKYRVKAQGDSSTLTDSATVTVTLVAVDSVQVSPATATIVVGATQQLSAVTKDSAGNILTDRLVTWASSNTSVATVSASGLVTGQSAGSAIITATSETKSGTSALTIQAPSHAGYYVAPNGSASGDGTSSRPWDLQTALNQPSIVHPGDTVWMRGGAYSGNFQSYLTGTAAAPVVLRQYPGEHARIAGTLAVGGSGTSRGSYSWYWGFEVYNPNPLGAYANGVSHLAPGSKLINLVVHDASGSGIYSGNAASGGSVPTEIYGCITYNNGVTDNQDHGLYVMNQGSIPRLVTDNIAFDNWSIGFQGYATAPSQFMDNVRFEGNVAFNNGTIGTSKGFEILLGGSGVSATGAVIKNNYTYRNNFAKTVDAGYYFNSTVNRDLTLTNNYLVGLLEVDDWVTATVTGNTVYSTSLAVTYASGLVGNRGNISGHTWSGNTFYGDSTANQWSYVAASGPNAFNPMTYATWLRATGFSNPGTYVGSAPTGVSTVVRPNQYEAGRANIAIYNWAGQSTAAVDVSNVLSIGQAYNLMSVFDVYGTPILSGTYDGNPLQVPLTAIPAPAPIARGHAGPTTGPTFNVFVLMKTP